MKPIFVMLAGILFFTTSQAQLKRSAICPVFNIDVLNGQLNDGLNPQSTLGEIKKSFPCFSEMLETASGSKCAGIFYEDKGIYFFTDRDYIEIRQNFKGKLSVPLMGASRKNLFRLLGNPVIKDIKWDAYRTAYGILVLYGDKAGKINKIQISNKSTETLKLCE